MPWLVSALPADRRSYGQALLRTIEFLIEGRPVASVAGSAIGGFPFTRRIEMILKGLGPALAIRPAVR